MHVTVAGKQVDTGEALKIHVHEGLDTITRKYFDHALEANVTFHRSRSQFACDINLKAGRGLTLRAEGEGPDAHRAFDEAAEHLAKRLRRYRRRMNEHSRSVAPEREAAAEEAPAGFERVLQAAGEEEEAASANGADHGTIIAEHPAEISLLSVGEAVMRMDLAHVPVLMFRNSATRALNVVYRRGDGHVGWIDPGGT